MIKSNWVLDPGKFLSREEVNKLLETARKRALPLPSYSLKVVEQYIGFERTQDEYGGTWAMAKYIDNRYTLTIQRDCTAH